MAIVIGGGINIGPGVTIQGSAPVLLANLVLYLDAGNTSSYPGSGTTWTDLSPSAKNGTLNIGVSYSATSGGSLVFNGTNGNVAVATANVITGITNNVSAEVWYKSNNLTPRLLNTGVSSQGFNFGYFSPAQATKYKVTKYGVIDLFVGNIPQDNNWHQAVLTYSNVGGTSVYVDGALSENTANNANITAGSSTVTIGQSEGGFLSGSIGIVRMYNIALTPTQVSQNFNADRGRYGI